MGNSLQVAGNHYLQPLSDSFQRVGECGAKSGAVAVQNPVQAASDRKRLQTTHSTQPLDDVRVSRILSSVVASCHSAQAPVSRHSSEWVARILSEKWARASCFRSRVWE